MYYLKYGEEYIYYPLVDSEQITQFSCKLPVNQSGQMSFTIPPTHPLYNKIQTYDIKNEIVLLEGELRADYNNTVEKFRGRAVRSSEDFNKFQKFNCIDQLSYLNDAECRAFHTGEGDVPVEATGLFGWVIAQYNAEIDPIKRFQVGINQGDLIVPGNRVDIESANGTSYSNLLKKELLQGLGGYIRVRYEKGTRYIDWIADFEKATQHIEFGSNLLAFSKSSDPSEIYTALRPTAPAGESGGDPIDISSILDGRLQDNFYKQGDIVVSGDLSGRYSIISRHKSFPDAQTPQQLLNMAIMDMKSQEVIDGLDIRAFDLSLIDPSIQSLNNYQYVRVTAEPYDFDKFMAVVQEEPDILVPGNSRYLLGKIEATLTNKNVLRVQSLENDVNDLYQSQEALSDETKANAERLDELRNTYVHIKYSPNPDGTDFTDDPQPDTKYIGTASTDSEIAPTDRTAYKWVYIVGVGGDPGTAATNVICGMSAFTIPCDSVGTVLGRTVATIPFSGWTGTNRASATAEITSIADDFIVDANQPSTETQNGYLLLRLNAGATLADEMTGEININFIVGEQTFEFVVSWSKSLAGQEGEQGASPYNINLGSEAITIACTSGGLVDGDAVFDVPFSAWVGEQRKAAGVVISGLPAGMTVTENTASTELQDGMFQLTVTNLASLGGANVRNGQIDLSFTVDSTVLNRRFNWSKAIAGSNGEDGGSYMIELSAEQITKYIGGELKPETMTATSFYISGEPPVRSTYDGYWQIFVSDDGAAWENYLSSEQTDTFAFSVADLLAVHPATEFVRIVLYSDAAFEQNLTERTVGVTNGASSYITPVIPDGLYIHNTPGDENYNVDGNMLLATNSIEMRENDTVFSRWSLNKAELGLTGENATIEFLNGLGAIKYEPLTPEIGWFSLLAEKALQIRADSTFNDETNANMTITSSDEASQLRMASNFTNDDVYHTSSISAYSSASENFVTLDADVININAGRINVRDRSGKRDIFLDTKTVIGPNGFALNLPDDVLVPQYDAIEITTDASGYAAQTLIIPVAQIEYGSGSLFAWEITHFESPTVYASAVVEFRSTKLLAFTRKANAAWGPVRLRRVCGVRY